MLCWVLSFNVKRHLLPSPPFLAHFLLNRQPLLTILLASRCGRYKLGCQFNQPIGKWNTSSTTNMDSMFSSAANFLQDISDWDVSNVKNFNGMFNSAGVRSPGQGAAFGDFGKWDVGSAKYMASMFEGTHAFNATVVPNVQNWDVSGVINFNKMFTSPCGREAHCQAGRMGGDWQWLGTNPDVSKWNTGSGTNFNGMFFQAKHFTSDVSEWNMKSATDTRYMFGRAASFNSDISRWDIGNLQKCSNMFRDARQFGSDVSRWEPDKKKLKRSEVESMFLGSGLELKQKPKPCWWRSIMGNGALVCPKKLFTNKKDLREACAAWVTDKEGMTAAHGDISTWGWTTDVTNLDFLLKDLADFDANIGAWDMHHIESAKGMFQNAKSFNQDISGWYQSKLSALTNAEYMFAGASSFNQSLGIWTVNRLTHMAHMFEGATAFAQDLEWWGGGHRDNEFNAAAAWKDMFEGSGLVGQEPCWFVNEGHDCEMTGILLPTNISGQYLKENPDRLQYTNRARKFFNPLVINKTVYGMPHNSMYKWDPVGDGSLLTFDTETGIVSMVPPISETGYKNYQYSGHAAVNDVIYMMPGHEQYVQIFNPATFGTSTGGWSISKAKCNTCGFGDAEGVVALGNKIYTVPITASHITIYDTASDVFSVSPAIPESDQDGINIKSQCGHRWETGVAVGGTVYGLPRHCPFLLIYDTTKNTMSVSKRIPRVPIGKSAADGWHGGVVIGTKIYGLPSRSLQMYVYDTTTDAMTMTSHVPDSILNLPLGNDMKVDVNGRHGLPGLYPHWQFRGGVARNGKVVCMPHNANYVLYYDPVADEWSASSSEIPQSIDIVTLNMPTNSRFAHRSSGISAFEGAVLVGETIFGMPATADSILALGPVKKVWRGPRSTVTTSTSTTTTTTTTGTTTSTFTFTTTTFTTTTTKTYFSPGEFCESGTECVSGLCQIRCCSNEAAETHASGGANTPPKACTACSANGGACYQQDPPECAAMSLSGCGMLFAQTNVTAVCPNLCSANSNGGGDASTSTSNVGMIAGIVASIFVLLACVGVAVVLQKKEKGAADAEQHQAIAQSRRAPTAATSNPLFDGYDV